jgi:alpha-ketoglutarate-dependent taurine dioxygenase
MTDPAVHELTFEPAGAQFGALVVHGLHVDEHATDPASAARVRDGLWQHGVCCIRFDAALDDDEARVVASMFGPIKDPVARTRDGELLRYGEDRQIIDAGFVLTDELRAELGDLNFGGDSERPGLFEYFHTDDSYVDRPASVTVLHARELPSGPGGATQFLDMRAALALVGAEQRTQLIGRRAVHAYNNGGAFPPRAAAEGPFEALPDVAHPVVRAHPHTQSAALYFDLDRATHIEGMDVAGGRALLRRLQDLAEQRAPRYAHEWHAHDVLVWDNASVQHCASGDFPVGEPRRFWRYMIEGDLPIPAGA